MANFTKYPIFLLASLVFLASIDAEASVEEFKKLEDDVFGQGNEKFWGDTVEKKIDGMIKLVESGSIPAEAQGDHTLEYLRSMTNDCKRDTCNLDEDLQRLVRLRKQYTGAPNLGSYLDLCQTRIKERCKTEIYKRAAAKLSSVDEESMKAVEALARQSVYELQHRRSRTSSHRLNPASPNHETIFKALAYIDPVGSKMMLVRSTNRKEDLAKFMDKIKLPCLRFLGHVDPSVKLYDAQYWELAEGSLKVTNWHCYLKKCKKVLKNWRQIFKDACQSYRTQLTEGLKLVTAVKRLEKRGRKAG